MAMFLRGLLELLRAPVAIASITPLALGPDDVLVLKVDKPNLAREHVTNLREGLARIWPGRKVLILDGTMSLSVMRTHPEEDTA